MMFNDFSAHDMPLLPLKTTTQGLDIYNMVKRFFMEEKKEDTMKKLLTTDGTGGHAGVIVQCKNNTDSPTFLHYPCIIQQQYDDSHHRDHN